jgi:hypothetical protein
LGQSHPRHSLTHLVGAYIPFPLLHSARC